MKIHLPNSAFLGNIDQFLRLYDPSNPNHLVVTANKKWIAIHPVVLCMVTALGINLKPENIVIEELEAKSKGYLARMGLFKLMGLDQKINFVEHESAGRFIPLSIVKNSDDITQFITEMIPLLHLEPKQSEPIKYIISELVRNVFEHSGSKNGAILCAQYYKKSNSIKIGIVDTGVGIKTTINHSHIADSDIDAIKLSLVPGVTGTTWHEGGTASNAGAGLFFIKSIAKVNRDFFVVYSGNAMYKLLRTSHDRQVKLLADSNKDKHSETVDLPYWQGTIVGVDIDLDRSVEFSELLELIRKTYFETIKERKKLRYKQAKFI